MKFIILLLIIISIDVSAQKENNYWLFGDSAGIDFSNVNNPTPIVSGIVSRGSSVSIADANGNLILYAATMPYFGPYTFLATKLFNSQHQMLLGADSITGAAWYNEIGLFPKPGDTTGNLFYIFSNSVGTAPNLGMYYTLVDMSLNIGLGGVVLENIQLDNNSYGDCLTTIKHGNGRDWWVISKWTVFSMVLTNRFYSYLITTDSIYGPFIQNLGSAMDYDFQKIIWHPEFNKFMLINVTGFMGEYDFDRCTGVITLNRIIYNDLSTSLSRAFWGGAYSPNGNVFYTSRTSYGGNGGDYNYLLQYDLTAIDIPSSCDTLDSTLYPIADCGDLRLAPDGKIYYSQAYPHGFPYQDSMRNYVNENLGVINNPDVMGAGCNFSPFSFYLGGKRTYYGLPNNPNYSLGPLTGSLCDTLSTSIAAIVIKPKLNLFYHNSWQTLFINADHLKGKEITLQIFDLSGRIVSTSKSTTAPPYFTKQVSMSGWSDGLYIVSLTSDKEFITGKFVKE